MADQHDGTTETRDIAHHGETVREALVKLDNAIDSARQGYARYLRVIVGTGLIRDEVAATLKAMVRTGSILNFKPAPGNRGAFLIELKR